MSFLPQLRDVFILVSVHLPEMPISKCQILHPGAIVPCLGGHAVTGLYPSIPRLMFPTVYSICSFFPWLSLILMGFHPHVPRTASEPDIWRKGHLALKLGPPGTERVSVSLSRLRSVTESSQSRVPRCKSREVERRDSISLEDIY